MKIVNYGSLNIDYVYQVEHFVTKGETISSLSLKKYSGGKGLNQSIALQKAGLNIYHAGMIGKDGEFLQKILEEEKINTSLLKISETIPSGNAIIQNDSSGDNCIILYGGTNQSITKKMVDETLSNFEKGDYIILQNEINQIPYIIEKAHNIGMKIVLNPAPINKEILDINLEYIDFLILNEVEAKFFIEDQNITPKTLKILKTKFPKAEIIVTLGENGSVYLGEENIYQKAFQVEQIDTTGAGDTFIGYYLASRIKGLDVVKSMQIASKAAAISVTKKGAAVSIPTYKDVENFNFIIK